MLAISAGVMARAKFFKAAISSPVNAEISLFLRVFILVKALDNYNIKNINIYNK